jgi:hypothetical protein
MNPTRRIRVEARAPSPSGQLRAGALAAVIAAGAALALGGCGGSSPSTTSTGGGGSNSSAAAGGDSSAGAPPNSQSVEAAGLRFARCMRAHGISNFADPTNGGELTIPPGDKNSPAFKSASNACKSLLPGGAGGAGPTGQKSDMTPAQELQLAKCIRAHGVPNFPDPNASGVIPQSGINPNSPAMKAALQACQTAGGPPPAP